MIGVIDKCHIITKTLKSAMILKLLGLYVCSLATKEESEF